MKNDDLYYCVALERVELLSRLLVCSGATAERDREIGLAWIYDLCISTKRNDIKVGSGSVL